MIFNLTDPEHSLWLELTRLKIQLHKISHQPMTAPTVLRDQLAQSTIEFIRSHLFDAIQGGLYTQIDEQFVFDSYVNAVVAEYLLIADRVFYHGELTYCAKALLNVLTSRFYDPKNCHFVSGQTFTCGDAPFSVEGKKLIAKFDDIERRLLSALVGQEIDIHENVLISYRRSLKSAAEKASIHFKQAQIIDAQISAKLRQDFADDFMPQSAQALDVRANCQILRALVYAVIWNNAQEYTNPIVGLAKTLTDHLTHYQGFDNEVADMCLALVESLQVDFNRTMLNRVVSKFEKITESKLEKLSDKAKEQVRLTWSILSQLNDEGLVTVAPSLRDFCANLKITIYYDAQDAAFEQIKQTLFARYDLGLRVYPVGENDRQVEV